MSVNVKIGNRVFNGIDGVALNQVEHNSKSALFSLMDWNAKAGTANYVKNKPFWIEQKELAWNGVSSDNSFTFTADGIGSFEFSLLSTTINPVPELMVGGNVKYTVNSAYNTITITAYCATPTQLDTILRDSSESQVCVLVQGNLLGFPASWIICELFNTADGSPLAPLFGWIDPKLLSQTHPIGLYAIKSTSEDGSNITYQLTNLKFNDIIINEEYGKFFHYLRNPIHVIPVTEMSAAILTSLDLSLYNPGDFIFLTNGELELS